MFQEREDERDVVDILYHIADHLGLPTLGLKLVLLGEYELAEMDLFAWRVEQDEEEERRQAVSP